ncbi:hypothetical protein R6Q57_018620 [Mikania cordata]
MSFSLAIHHLLPKFPFKNTTTTIKQSHIQSPTFSSSISQTPNPKTPSLLSNHLLSLSIAFIAFTSPPSSPALPSLNNPRPAPNLPPATTPFSQSKNLITGLDDGKIRPCPSNNPGCVSSNPKSSSFAFPWRIPEKFLDNALQQLQEAILETQKNAKIEIVENTPDGSWPFTNGFVISSTKVYLPQLQKGQYMQATADGGFGRDVLEFLVKGDVVSYRCMSTKVTYVYPFTTALGDSKGQEERTRKIVDQLGWDAPSFSAMD